MSRGKPFESGNKFGKGRPKGSRNQDNSVMQRLIEENIELLITKTISAGLRDNTKSRLWCLEYWAKRTSSAPKLKVPPIQTLGDIAVASGLVLNAVASNKCSPAKGLTLMSMLVETRKSFENRDLAAKVDELERLLKAA